MMRNVLGMAAALALLASIKASADYHLRSPSDIDVGQPEFEHNGAASFDRLPQNSGAHSYTVEFGTGLTTWWRSEVEAGFNRNPGFGEPTLLTELVSENMFQLTEPGEQFVDLGLYAEYGQSMTAGRHAAPNEFIFGPAIGKAIGRTSHLMNLFLTRQLGPNQTTQGLAFTYAWQSRWNLWPPLSPAIEIYGDPGVLGRSPSLSKQQLLVGPVAVGRLDLNELGLGHAAEVKYEVGWLFGATRASPNGTLRWRLEVEIPF